MRLRGLAITAAITTAALGAIAGAVPMASMDQRAGPAGKTATTPVSGYKVVRIFPHDPQAFTQGLTFLDGVLFEGTGMNGRSTIRKVKLENGEVLQVQKIAPQYFGEGVAVVGNTIVQLTWRSGVGFVYDRPTFRRTRTFTYRGEGWGLAYDGTRLIMSDGTAYLRFLDPQTLKETGRVQVRDGAMPVLNLNELEMVKGELFANIWQSDAVARITPQTGQVTGWIDMSGLLSPRDAAGVDVLNGIAYDAAGDRLFVTGKLWPKLFQIEIVPRPVR